MSDDRVLILIGTVTGHSDDLAHELAPVFEYEGLAPTLIDMYDARPELFVDYQQVLICTSTHGDGALPDNAEPFYDALESAAPDLSMVQFAVCALGDHEYDPYFCEAGQTFASLLTRLGAAQVVPNFEIDGDLTDAVVEQAQAWALDVIDCYRGAAVSALAA